MDRKCMETILRTGIFEEKEKKHESIFSKRHLALNGSTGKTRISSIDIMRGLVMVVMALDHARDFYHADALAFDPTDLDKTNPILFFTRIITHYCAPTFVLLSGTAIRISHQYKTKKALSIFLLTRGFWLIFLEVTVIRFSWLFQFYYDSTALQVIWAIGVSMMILSILIHLPLKVIVGLGVLITLGQDVLHAIHFKSGDSYFEIWVLAYQSGLVPIDTNHFVLVFYPFLPWLGIMLIGYGIGEWYISGFDQRRRKKFLFRTGLAAIVAFVMLRYFNLYGDPAPWSFQKDVLYTFMSFINVSKYPVSLLYTLMALGPVLIILAWIENRRSIVLNPFAIFGRVPLFYYILHLFLLHIGALASYMILADKSFSELDFHIAVSFGGVPPGAGYPLVGTYIAWIIVVVVLYPLCKLYNKYKSTHKQWWLSYL
jgi:uncharacterized membrane protein